MARGPRSVLLGDRQIAFIQNTLDHLQLGVENGLLNQDWIGATPEERRTFKQLLEKFTLLMEER